MLMEVLALDPAQKVMLVRYTAVLDSFLSQVCANFIKIWITVIYFIYSLKYTGQFLLFIYFLVIPIILISHNINIYSGTKGQLHRVNGDLLGWWLCERQLPSGGLNGRPEKLPDVCYSWWVLASLTMLGRLHWINADKMRVFILATQVSWMI